MLADIMEDEQQPAAAAATPVNAHLSLATGIRPDSVESQELLRRAGSVLLSATGSAALTGYEDGPDRACRTAAAAYLTVLNASPISRCERDRVLCLAAVLEAAGLRPLILVAAGRCWPGLFTSESRLSGAVEDSDSMIANLVRSGQLVILDPAGLTSGRITFAEAVLAGYRMALDLGDPGNVALLDVQLAHREGYPAAEPAMPAAHLPELQVPGALIGDALIPYDDAPTPLAALDLPAQVASIVLDAVGRPAEPGYAPGAFRPADDAPRRVRAWKRTLLDLTLRNPLLNLPKTAGRGIEFVLPPDGLARLEDLIHGGKSVTLIARDEVGPGAVIDADPDLLLSAELTDKRATVDVLTSTYRDRLRNLRRTANALEQETGANYLYLALGALVHPKRDGTFAKAPLFLLPVRIEGGVGWRPYRLVADSDGVAAANHSLVEWLRTKHGLEIPELEQPVLADIDAEDVGIDITASLAAISDALVKARLEYRVVESAGLYLLRFSTFRMWQDLDQGYLELMRQPVVAHLVARAGQPFVEDQASPVTLSDRTEVEIPLPIAADSSQLRAVQMAAQGRSFVLEGPPGTGKSQTITNIIAHSLALGRSVLFVAEKQAALAVVKQRLEKVGLGDFILDLHGRDQRLNTIRAQLNTALAASPTSDEIGWKAVISRFGAQLEPLARYPRELHEIGPAGLSAWSAYDTLLALRPGPVAVIPAGYLGNDNSVMLRCVRATRELPTLAASAKLRPQHPWSLVSNIGVGQVPGEVGAAAAAALESVRRQLLSGSTELAGLVTQLAGPLQFQTLRPLLTQLKSGVLPPSEEMLDRAGRQGWENAMTALLAQVRHLRGARAGLLSRFAPTIFVAVDMNALLVRAREADRGFFGRKRRRRAVVDQLSPYLALPEAIEAKSVSALVEQLAAAGAEFAAVMAQLAELGGVWLPGWHPSRPDAAESLAAEVAVTTQARQVRIAEPLLWQWLSRHQNDTALLRSVVDGWQRWLQVVGMNPDALARWAGHLGWAQSWHRDGAQWADETAAHGLREAHRFALVNQELSALQAAGLGVFADAVYSQEIPVDQAEAALQRGVASTALQERIYDLGFSQFDGAVHDHRIEEFLQTAGAVRLALPTQLGATVVAHRERSVARAPDDAAALRVQLGRKRGGMSFRELFSAYGEQITAATPCLMMSPTSVAAYLQPVAGQFDLVIFDEASQIRTSQAIGVMGRGRSVIIVGDSKQMPPTSVMMSSTSAADTEMIGPEGLAAEQIDGADVGAPADPAPSDADSILMEAVESGLPQVWLSWHYRSRDESLIAFSNQHYYSGGLASFPAPGGDVSVGVRRIRVPGNFERGTAGSRTNPVEAAAVVCEIGRRLADPLYQGQSLGVVTFNIQQRDLIANLLEDSKDDAILAALTDSDDAEQIFVKNLENVQGDERDVILFSPAYSVDPASGQLPLNFGPLSNAGGERRLNVAITRARRQVLLFTSFDPADIELRRTSAVGTHHFRAYLESAVLNDATSVPQPALPEPAVVPIVPPGGSSSLPGARLRNQIADALQERGLVAQTDFGLSSFKVDIAVRRPESESWQVAVMLDGPQWLARRTVADRDGTPGLLHSMMGWPAVQRVWLPHWINNRDEVLSRIIDSLPVG